MSGNGQSETTNTSSTEAETEDQETSEVSIQVGVEEGRVIVIFGQPIATLGLPPEGARQMADALILHANQAEKLAAK